MNAAAGLVVTLVLFISATWALDVSTRDIWPQWKERFGKMYENPELEMTSNLIFQRNVKKIIEHNLKADLGEYSFRLGLNGYTDRDYSEMKKTMNGYKKRSAGIDSASHFIAPANVEIPDTVDWRDEGYVTPVKNQLQCGSCWAFSAVGSLEGQHFKLTGDLVPLSEQNLVDCDTHSDGCSGGYEDSAFLYIRDNNGIDTEECYPYTGYDDGDCEFRKDCVGATCTGYTQVPLNEDILKEAVATVGPISVAIDASNDSFQFYQDGVYDEPDCDRDFLDHAVLLVGYGTTDGGLDYWLVKNSWGTDWGMEGYIMMSRNKENQCGIATDAAYPLM